MEGIASPRVDVHSVYYNSTAVLQPGQILCYLETPSTVLYDPKGFPNQVEQPNSDNYRVPAGIVHPDSFYKKGPCQIKIYVPQKGDVLQVLVNSITAIALGDMLYFDNDAPTSTTAQAATGIGAMREWAVHVSTGTASAEVNARQAHLADLAYRLKAVALATAASATATTERTRNLLWVQFR